MKRESSLYPSLLEIETIDLPDYQLLRERNIEGFSFTFHQR